MNPVKSLDITGEVCPITFIKVKLRLEEMSSGEVLEVLLDDGVPMKNVPRSLQSDGHRILLQEKLTGESYRLLVEKDGLRRTT